MQETLLKQLTKIVLNKHKISEKLVGTPTRKDSLLEIPQTGLKTTKKPNDIRNSAKRSRQSSVSSKQGNNDGDLKAKISQLKKELLAPLWLTYMPDEEIDNKRSIAFLRSIGDYLR